VTRVSGGGTIARWRTSLSLGKLKAGSWWVAVVATDMSGQEARAEGQLELLVP
jgi:hypothetical protein